MKRSHRLISLALLAALTLASCGTRKAAVFAVPEEAQAGELVGLNGCQYQPSGSKTKFAAECGTLVVPENWEDAGARLIAVPVVRVPASGPKPAEPVFYFAGGPGSPNLGWEPPDWLLKKHDVVIVGYRGAEGSVVLSCPGLNRMVSAHVAKDIFSDQAREDSTAAAKRCAASFQAAGVDISAYSMPAVVEDMEAARKALGYEKINVFSESYGTRVAQIYAYMHPDSLNRLVLIGVNTPGHFIWDREAFDGMLAHMSELCAQDSGCSSRTSDLARTMYAVNHNMPDHWLFFRIDPGTVRQVSHYMFFSNPNMPMIIDAYLAAGHGDPSGLAMMNLIMSLMPFNAILGDQMSKGGTADLDRYQGLESIDLGDSVMGAPLAQLIWPLAEAWPVDLIPQELRALQESDVQMLLVNGTVDFSTPPNALDEAKPYYHNAQTVLLPEFSHVGDVMSLQPAAVERLVMSYYDTGVADATGFIYQPLSFKPRMSLIMVARLLVAAMVVLPALVIFGVAAVVRRVRRRRAANR